MSNGIADLYQAASTVMLNQTDPCLRQEESIQLPVKFRRGLPRLVRLLRQDDVVLVNDLIGLACIRMGAEAIFERALSEGKLELALAAAVAAAEAPPQKVLSAARRTSMELGPYLRKGADGTYRLELPDPPFQATLKMANGAPDRRFRHEAMWSLHIIEGLGNSEQAADARTSSS